MKKSAPSKSCFANSLHSKWKITDQHSSLYITSLPSSPHQREVGKKNPHLFEENPLVSPKTPQVSGRSPQVLQGSAMSQNNNTQERKNTRRDLVNPKDKTHSESKKFRLFLYREPAFARKGVTLYDHQPHATYDTIMSEYKDISALNANIEANSGFVKSLTEGMSRIVVGQPHLTQALLIGLLSDGHILLEGVPGLAKTLAIRTLASLIDAEFGRIQFTPDLLPADVVGTLVYSRKEDAFNVRRGPIFANFVLADEINRAPAKVQSALLQAMQERQVTIGDDTMALPDPFLVMATQNPIEQEGTYTLPEAQTDRFMLKVVIDYPSLEEEQRIVRASMSGNIGDTPVSPVVDLETIRRARQLVKSIYVDERIERYVANLVFATRYPEQYGLEQLKPYIAYGGSPRASISLALAARSLAFLNRRGYVVPDDVRALAGDVLRHRIGLTYEAEAAGVTADQIIGEILAKVEVP